YGNDHTFNLVSYQGQAKVFIDQSESDFIKLAVQDMVNDVKKITGKELEVVSDLNNCSGSCVVIGTVSNLSSIKILKKLSSPLFSDLQGKWETYKVKSITIEVEPIKSALVIAGSDPRGTMFGIYHFLENYLEVDPLYFWSGREPLEKSDLMWEKIDFNSETPTFKYRGWFINDEDLLTAFMPSGGKRNIDYPYYGEVVNPRLMEHVVEALVRSKMNLIIPASFIDIMNPAEEELVKIAAKRGVFISQHHVEPVGVSAFAFFNYWKAKGEDKLFSYYSSKEELIEVWEAYAKKWSTYPNVIWQIGLRGIGDRPMWMADPGIPQTEEDFGRIISEAIKEQIRIIKKYDKRSDIPLTTTLWAEGASLFAEGYLEIPQNCMIIFSDNSPGWIFTPDFYQVAREENRKCGIYYHQQVWGSGPHLAPAVHPSRTHRLIGEAIERQSGEYAIINVSNIREFIFGIDATSKMLVDFKNFSLEQHLDQWFENRYPSAPKLAQEAYQSYYDIFVEHDEKGVPMLLDGQTRGSGGNHLRKIQEYLKDPEKYKAENQPKESTKLIAEAEWGKKHLSAQFLPSVQPDAYQQKVIQQRLALANAMKRAESLQPLFNPIEFDFFETDLLSNVLLMSGLTKWLDHILKARQFLDGRDETRALEHLEIAHSFLSEIDLARKLRTQGKWKNWYNGDTKVNLPNTEKLSEQTLELLRQKVITGKN
uniref:glycosyl hydrolase 115 family protein n=1 Tax=Aquiflexum sp. TaxID=1872584 RepID=UPI0035932D41